MKTLYLRIYITIVAVLLLFALSAGWVAHQRVEEEKTAAKNAWSERASAWADLLQNSLPPNTAPEEEQRQALLDWSERLKLPLALDNEHGERIATSKRFTKRMEAAQGQDSLTTLSLEFADGRKLWIIRGKPSDQELLNAPDARRQRGAASPAPLPPTAWWGHLNPFTPSGGTGLIAALMVLFVAVALGAFPVVRQLTKRLERLKYGVEKFGEGQLHERINDVGKDEIAAVARSFNQAAERIESLIRANRSLLANASHEFRSPLARLKMAVSLLGNALPDQVQALKKEIDRDIQELDALVEEVLMASRLDAQAPISMESVELLGLAAEEASRVGANADGEPVIIQANERFIRRAMRNLLENAHRYGLGHPIDITIQPNQDMVHIIVDDQGLGVPTDQRERIFEAFYRMPGHAETAGGVGLGLSLVRQIAKRHHGRVYCTDRPGGGSRFVLQLPLNFLD